MMNAGVRTATPADLDAIWPLVRAFATSFAPDRRRFETTFRAVLGDEAMLCLVAEHEKRVVGYLLANRHDTFFADAPVVWVEELMVDETVRRAGTGRRLMRAAEDWAHSAGAAYIALATRRASGFYAGLGYEESATFFRKTLG